MCFAGWGKLRSSSFEACGEHKVLIPGKILKVPCGLWRAMFYVIGRSFFSSHQPGDDAIETPE